jgi:NTE family protein
MSTSRALILTGGGMGGAAWETGLLIGLMEHGVDLAAADLIVVTSAGSVTGAQLACGHDLWAAAEGLKSMTAAAPDISLDDLQEVGGAQNVDDASDHDRMLRFGQIALAADPFPEEMMLLGFAAYADEPFPENYACTAIDCESGELTVWDAKSGAPLDRAVASSCGAPGIFPAITINGRRYYDGGVCSATNAQLAVGYDKVLVVHMMIVLPDPAGGGKAVYAHDAFPAELDLLVNSGAQVEVIDPSDTVTRAIGINLMDPASLPTIIDAGIAQGAALAPKIAAFWN